VEVIPLQVVAYFPLVEVIPLQVVAYFPLVEVIPLQVVAYFPLVEVIPLQVGLHTNLDSYTEAVPYLLDLSSLFPLLH
jgi:hypothetical protein